jgi:hypothetical protein
MTEVNVATLFGVAFVAGVGAYFGAHLREKGKNLATKEDIDRIVRKTEEIKAEVGAGAWLNEKRWDRKWECYVDMVRRLGEIHTLIREQITLDPHRSDYGQRLEDKKRAVTEAFVKFRQAGSIARITVEPSVRTVMTRLGDERNKSIYVAEQVVSSRGGAGSSSQISRGPISFVNRGRCQTSSSATLRCP